MDTGDQAKPSVDLHFLYPKDYARYNTFLNEMATFGPAGGAEGAERIKHFLLTSSGKVDRSLVNSLRSKASEAKDFVNPHVRRGRALLRNHFRTHPLRQTAMNLGGDLILYGSLEFGDNRNTDIDLLVALRKPDEGNKVKEMVDVEHDPLTDKWHRAGFALVRGGAQITYFSLETIKDEMQQCIDNQDSEYFIFGADRLSEAITGTPLFPQMQNWFTKYTRDALHIAESEPIIAATINYLLEDTLQTRLSRA